MEIVTKIAPICLALIMLGLGLGLSVKDFTRILRTPKDFFVVVKLYTIPGLIQFDIFDVNNIVKNR